MYRNVIYGYSVSRRLRLQKIRCFCPKFNLCLRCSNNFHHHVLIARRKDILRKLYRTHDLDITRMNTNIARDNIEEIEGIGIPMIFMFCLIYRKSVPQ